MKKLNLLMPDVHTGYLGTRRKERVRYLSVPSELSMKMIEDDMQTGKIIFQGLLDQLKKAPCRTVVIRTNSEEVGLMAVCYLASAYNKIDHRNETFDDETEDKLEKERYEFGQRISKEYYRGAGGHWTGD